MTLSWKVAAVAACVVAIFGTAILWTTHREKVTAHKLAEAARISRGRAERGDAMAQYSLGNMYRAGEGVPQDYAEAIRWYRKAADQNYTTAETALCYIYDRGQGVPQNSSEAARWCRRAAERGDVMAQSYLGFAYSQGRGLPLDYDESVRWYRKAADQGYADAQYALGFMYSKGQGVRIDPAEAIQWYRKAAGQGNANAQVALRSMGQERPLARWPLLVTLLSAVLVLAVPRRFWGRTRWLPFALCSAICTTLLLYEVLAALSLAPVHQALSGTLWSTFGGALVLGLLAVGSAIFTYIAARFAMREWKGDRRA